MKPILVLAALAAALCAEPATPPFPKSVPARPPAAGTVTTSRFGNGTITRDAAGNTWTTSRFGNGTTTKGPAGSTWTTTRFGNGTLATGTGTPPPAAAKQPAKK